MVGDLVYDTDPTLVALYRFETFTADGYLKNNSLAPAYSGYNNMDTSGTITQAPDVPALLPSGSGAQVTSATALFHTHPTGGGGGVPQSGFEVSSSTPFSFGFWGKPSGALPVNNDRSWFDKWTSATPGLYYRLQMSETSDVQHWSLTLGGVNGTVSIVIENTSNSITSGDHEFVCATVDPGANTAILWVSGVMVASSIALSFSPGPSGIGSADVPTRMLAHRAFSSMGAVNNVGIEGGLISEAFFFQRALSELEVSGIYENGIVSGTAPVVAPTSGMSNSDVNDSLKDNIGRVDANTSNIIFASWKNYETANPSGIRHATSGFHPAFEKILGNGSSSGLNFGQILQGTASGVKVVTFRNATTGTTLSGMKFWMSDYSALPSSGWDVSYHADSAWIHNLTLPSGSGVVGRSYAAASSVLRSDRGLTISGYNLDGTVQSGEQEISQYIYLGFTTDGGLPSIGTFGPDGFAFRLSAYNV